MVEHLEDSQGVSDFMGHLAGKQPKRGQFFVLPEQFLGLDDALKQSRLLDRQRGKLGQRRGDVYFVI